MGGVVKAIASVGLIVVGVVTGNPGAIIAGVGSLVRTVANELSDGPPKAKAQEGRLNATIDPATPRKMVFGRTAMGTDVRYQCFTGTDQEYYHQIICVASHRVNSIEMLFLDQELAWSSASGVAAKFAGYLTVAPILEGSAANAINIDGNWNAANGARLTGCAYVHIRYKRTGASKNNESPFSASITTRMTIVGEGIRTFDARFDSTRGGSGTMRADDQATWAFSSGGTECGRNPSAQLGTFMLGWRINGKLAVGCGMPANRIDWGRSITAANGCDEGVTLAAGGSEPRYRTDCLIGEGDDRGAAFDLWKSSCNALLRDAGGRIAFDLLLNDLASPVITFTEDDVLEGGTWKQSTSLTDYRNVARGRYTDPRPSALYQFVDWPGISVAAPDAIDRVLSLDFPAIQSASQAQRCAKQKLQELQAGGEWTGVMGQRAWACQIGDPVRFTFWPLGFVSKSFRVAAMNITVDGRVPMTLTEEQAVFYAWLNEDRAAVSLPTPTTYDYLNNPMLTGDGADGQDGASAFTLVNVANMTITSPSSVEKTSSGTGWDGKARTGEAYSGGAVISADVPRDAGIGMTTDPTADTGYGSVDYWFRNSGNGNAYLFRNGVPTYLGASASIERLTVESNGSTLRYYRNGVEVTSIAHAANSAGETLFGVINVANEGVSVENITFASAGTDGSNGTNGTDAVVFRQDGTPTSPTPQDGNLWYRPTSKELYRYTSGSWERLLGNLSTLGSVSTGQIDPLAVATGNIADNATSATVYAIGTNFSDALLPYPANPAKVATLSSVALDKSASGTPCLVTFSIDVSIDEDTTFLLELLLDGSPIYSFATSLTRTGRPEATISRSITPAVSAGAHSFAARGTFTTANGDTTLEYSAPIIIVQEFKQK